MIRLFVDTSALLYATGGEHPLRPAARALLRAAELDQVELHASVEAVQEFVFHRLRMGDRTRAMEEARLVERACTLHPFDADVLALALGLMEASMLRGRDAVHAATALHAGFASIVSADPDFDQVPGLRRVDLADWSTVGDLGSAP